MKLKRLAIAIPMAVCAAVPAHAADKILFGPAPEWVVQHPLPSAPPASADLPLQFLEVDTQVHVEGNTQTIYSAAAMKFLKSEGLQAGDLNLSWDPATEALTVNKVLIHRGDKTIDVLGQGQTFTVLRREQDLEQSTLTGRLTANLFPEGLQVGDVLEIVTTRTQSNPVTGDHAEEIFGPLNIPAGRINVSLEWPKGRTMRLAESADLPQWQHGARGQFETASISLDNAEPVVVPSGAPARFGVVRMAEATDYASWAQVADIFVPLYKKASQIPADGALHAELEKIRAASADPVKRAEAALQLVENQVRYVALEMGASGLVPADAEQTWSRKFGDCKAKTALLLGLLRELGVEAEPVVVNTTIGDAIHDRLPAAGLFNHILVRATIAGKTYWLDGTRTGDTSLARLDVPDFGWGLPIRPASALVQIVPPPLEQPNEELAIELDASKGVHAPVPAKLEETLRGDAALGADQALTALAGAARDQALRQYWRNRFDFIEPEKYDFAFDQSTGELHMTMQGTATMEWDNGWFETSDTSVGYRADFSRAPGANHDAPFAVNYPVYGRTTETVLLPPGFTGKVTSDNTDVDETIGGFEYRRKATLTGNKLVVERTQRSLVPEIAYKDAVAAQSRLRELNDDAVYLRIPDNYHSTPADLTTIAAATSSDPAELVSQGVMLEGGGKYDDALSKFTRATELDANNGDAWANRGFTEVMTGKLAQAEGSLARAKAIDPKNVVLLNAHGIIDGQHGNYQAALDDFDAVLKLYPTNTFAAEHRVGALEGLGRTKEGLAAVDELIAKNPTELLNYGTKVSLLMQQGDRAAAEKIVDGLLGDMPKDPDRVAMAVQLYSQLGSTDKARALVQSTPVTTPTALSWFNKARVREPSDKEGMQSDLDQALKLDAHFLPALLMRAQLLESEGKKDAALADVDTALAGYPSNSMLLAERARLLAGAGKKDEALKDLDTAIAGAPQSFELYLQKANLLKDLGRKDDALKVAAAMVAAGSDQTYPHVAAAKIYAAFGEHSQALAEFDRALAIKPEAYVYINRSQVLPPDDLDGRLADVEKALALEPDLPEALGEKAGILSRKGDNAAAAGIYSKLLEKDGKNPYYLDERGIALWRAGQHDDAQRDFAAEQKFATGAGQLNGVCYQKAMAAVDLDLALQQCQSALRLEADSAAILDSRATVYLQMGRYDQAKADFDSALAKSPQLTTSLIGRAIAKLHLGDQAGARADISAARKIDATAVDRFRGAGIAVPPELIQLASSH